MPGDRPGPTPAPRDNIDRCFRRLHAGSMEGDDGRQAGVRAGAGHTPRYGSARPAWPPVTRPTPLPVERTVSRFVDGAVRSTDIGHAQDYGRFRDGGRMGRKRGKTGFDTLAALPWPFGLVAGIAGFLAVRDGIPWWFSRHDGALPQAIAQQSEGAFAPLAWILLLLCWLAALASFLKARHRRRLLDTPGKPGRRRLASARTPCRRSLPPPGLRGRRNRPRRRRRRYRPDPAQGRPPHTGAMQALNHTF